MIPAAGAIVKLARSRRHVRFTKYPYGIFTKRPAPPISNILLPLQMIVPLLKQRREHGGGLHVEVEEINREGDHEKAEGNQQQVKRNFQKVFHIAFLHAGYIRYLVAIAVTNIILPTMEGKLNSEYWLSLTISWLFTERELFAFGASYLYPIFVKTGLIKTAGA
jgi:hypothetical protein